jgi:hypothetical protein
MVSTRRGNETLIFEDNDSSEAFHEYQVQSLNYLKENSVVCSNLPKVTSLSGVVMLTRDLNSECIEQAEATREHIIHCRSRKNPFRDRKTVC